MKKAFKIILFIIISNFLSVNLNAQVNLSTLEDIRNNEPKVYQEILFHTNKTPFTRYSEDWYTALKFQAYSYILIKYLIENDFSKNNDMYKGILKKALKMSMEVKDGEVYINYIFALDLFETLSGLKVDEL